MKYVKTAGIWILVCVFTLLVMIPCMFIGIVAGAVLTCVRTGYSIGEGWMAKTADYVTSRNW